jgi:hypothetical protein
MSALDDLVAEVELRAAIRGSIIRRLGSAGGSRYLTQQAELAQAHLDDARSRLIAATTT